MPALSHLTLEGPHFELKGLHPEYAEDILAALHPDSSSSVVSVVDMGILCPNLSRLSSRQEYEQLAGLVQTRLKMAKEGHCVEIMVDKPKDRIVDPEDRSNDIWSDGQLRIEEMKRAINSPWKDGG